MPYYPKSKILTNQYTRGQEYVIKNSNQDYSGYYYILSNGKLYVGKEPNQSPQQELIKLTLHNNTQVVSSNFILPISFYPQPNNEDYKRGYMMRYFIKRRNADFTTIKEISKSDYELFNSNLNVDTNLYVVISLNWKITGPLYDDFRDKNYPKAGIIDTNKKLVILKERIFPGFSNYFHDYSQFSSSLK